MIQEISQLGIKEMLLEITKYLKESENNIMVIMMAENRLNAVALELASLSIYDHT